MTEKRCSAAQAQPDDEFEFFEKQTNRPKKSKWYGWDNYRDKYLVEMEELELTQDGAPGTEKDDAML